MESNVDFNITCLVIWGDIVYMGRIGSGRIYLLREGKILNLSDHLLSMGQSIVSTASGYAKPDDVFVLTTPAPDVFFQDNKVNHIIELDQEALDNPNPDLDNHNISLFILKVIDTGEEIHDSVLEKEEPLNIEDTKKEGSFLNLGNIYNDKIKGKVEGFDMKNKAENISSLIKSKSQKTSSTIIPKIKEAFLKIDWKAIFKSITTVIVTFFELIFDTIMHFKDRTNRQ
jgi:hypothetical protein